MQYTFAQRSPHHYLWTMYNFIQHCGIYGAAVYYPTTCPALLAYLKQAQAAGIPANTRHALRLLLGTGTPAMQALPAYAALQAAITKHCA